MARKILSSVAVSFKFVAFAWVVVIASASPISAQRVASNSAVGISRIVHSATRTADSASSVASSSGEIAPAAVRAVAATSAGLVAGYIGAVFGARMSGSCSCDDPGLVGAIFGGLGGVALGSSLGAAAPGLGSICTLNERFARTLIGSVVGTVAGIAAAEASRQILALPLLAVGGSVVSLGRCMGGGVLREQSSVRTRRMMPLSSARSRRKVEVC